MRRFFYEAPAEIMRNYTTTGHVPEMPNLSESENLFIKEV